MNDKDVATGLGLTPLDETFRLDPYPVLRDLRERDDVSAEEDERHEHGHDHRLRLLEVARDRADAHPDRRADARLWRPRREARSTRVSQNVAA